MEFIDNSGHKFILESYSKNPIGYEYDNMPYIFWMNTWHNEKLSVNNYYFKEINFLVETDSASISDLNSILKINITIQSDIYRFIPNNILHEAFKNADNIKDIYNKIEIDIDNANYQQLTQDDLTCAVIQDENKTYALIPVYIIGMSDKQGVWTSDILIYVNNNGQEEWTPVTVGGDWGTENEIVEINASNMGISLPKDILKAVYSQSFYNDTFDERLYSKKLKEYLLDYQHLRMQQGNYAGAIAGLSWFEWRDNVTMSKLLKTDNDIQDQYLRDFFNTDSDFMESFKKFRNSTYISLVLKDNTETGEYYKAYITNNIGEVGEGMPVLEDLLDKLVLTEEGRDEPLYYWRPYYDWCFDQLGLKLAALAYYYERYFLPVHLNIHSAAIEHKVYMNVTKLSVNRPVMSTVLPVINMSAGSDTVTFPKGHIIYLTHQHHIVDEHYNEFETVNESKTLYEIDDTCMAVPVRFTDGYHNCVLILMHNDIKIYESQFNFFQKNSDSSSVYHSLVIYPKYLDYAGDWVNNDFTIYLLCDNKWYTYNFTVRIPDANIQLGTLQYDLQDFRQLASISDNNIEFNIHMSDPGLAVTRHAGFLSDLEDSVDDNIKFQNFLKKYIQEHNIPNSDKYYNSIHIFDIYKETEPENLFTLPENMFLFFDGYMFKGHYDPDTRDTVITIYNKPEDYIYISGDTDTLSESADVYDWWDLQTDIEKYQNPVLSLVTEEYGYYTDINGDYTGTAYANVTMKEYAGQMTFRNFGDFKAYRPVGDKIDNITLDDNGQYQITVVESGNTLTYRLDYTVKYAKLDSDGQFEEYIPTIFEISDITKLLSGNINSNYAIIVSFWYDDITAQEKYIYHKYTGEVTHKDDGGYGMIDNGTGYSEEKKLLKINCFKYHDNIHNIDLPVIYPGMHWYDIDSGWNPEHDVNDAVEKHLQIENDNIDTADTVYNFKNYFQKKLSNNTDNAIIYHLYAEADDTDIQFWLDDEKITFENNETDISVKPGETKILYIVLPETIKNNIKDSTDIRIFLTVLSDKPADKKYTVMKYNPEEYQGEGLFTLDFNKKQYTYGENKGTGIVALYNDFFEKNLNYKIKLNVNAGYDFYLMHDSKQWYGVYISRRPLSRLGKPSNYNIKKTDKEIYFKGESTNRCYKLVHYKSGRSFLVNRMRFLNANGINHFTGDDIIAARLVSNSHLLTDINAGSKWYLKGMSAGMPQGTVTESMTEEALLSLPKGFSKFPKGYYNLSVRYTLGNDVHRQYMKTARLRVD